MPVIDSQIDTQGEAFQANRESMLGQVEAFRAAERLVIDKAEEVRGKFDKRGQLMPWERVTRLLDPGTEFLELASLAGLKMYDDKDGSGAGGGVIAGIGQVCGVRCLVSASNSAIKGGTITPAGLRKTLRLQEIAAENRLPVITLAESGGANLNYASEIFVEGARAFANQARLSALGVPQVTIVHGNATAGGAYQPGLSDYVVMVRNRAKLFLAGPPLVKAATGEDATDEELGGAEMHTSVAGTAEYLAEDDGDAIRIVREVMKKLPWRTPDSTPAAYRDPLYDAEELLGIIPTDTRQPYDVREVIARIADASDFLDFKHNYDNQTICGHIEIEGHPVGVIGNNAPITPEGAAKTAQFIQLCDQSGIPLLFLHNTTGFVVGSQPEQAGIIKHGSKMIQAVANARVPRISILIGGSYGAGNYAMCGRGLDPRFIFAWPNSRVAVMGGAQAGKVLRIVTEQKHARLGKEPDPKMLEVMEKATEQKLNKESTALYGTARLWDDGMIDPRDTRRVLASLLQVCRDAERRKLNSNTFGVARL